MSRKRRVVIPTVVGLLFIGVLASCTGAGQATTTTADAEPYEEIVNGIRVVYETNRFVVNDKDARASINEALTRIEQLSKPLADEIRQVPVYVVDYPDRCQNGRALPPGKVLAGCFWYDDAGEPFVELAMGNNGHQLFTVVHELGHIIGNGHNPWGTQREITYLYDVYFQARDNQPATKYGEEFFYEAYADEFAWYVLRNDDLKQCCPARYAYFDELFEQNP